MTTLVDEIARAIDEANGHNLALPTWEPEARAAITVVAKWLSAEADAIWPPGTYVDNPAEAAIANKAAIIRALASHLEKEMG